MPILTLPIIGRVAENMVSLCQPNLHRSFSLLLIFFTLRLQTVFAEDWPMWRHDANRSAASSEKLPGTLQRQWSHQFSSRKQTWDDPLNHDLMSYDRVFEPIVANGRMFIGFNDTDKLLALDVTTGRELWSAYAEAPVRLPPVAWKEYVYFCSDDGFLYCVQAKDGELIWKFRGAPNSQHAIGNRRLISAWPARGGPVVRDGTVFFAASVWPFMGTFLYALHAESGTVKWVNDQTGSHYTKQPHSASAFAGVAPQGALVATEKYLVVPGGRSVPAVFDRSNGKLLHFEINAGGKGTGGSFVAANERSFFVHTRGKGTREFKLKTGVKTAFMPNEPVLAGDWLYSAQELENGERVIRAYDKEQKQAWEIAADGLGDLILAGNQLIAAGQNTITAIDLPEDSQPAKIRRTLQVQGQVERLLVANNQLFAVTDDGQIAAYGQAELPASAIPILPTQRSFDSQTITTDRKQLAGQVIDPSVAEGYALWFGRADAPLVDAIAENNPFVQFAIVDNDPDRVTKLRRKLDSTMKYGSVTVHQSELASFRAPQYVAHQIFVSAEVVTQRNPSLIKTIYQSVRPYNGVMHLLGEADELESMASWIRELDLEKARVEVRKHGVVVRREGPLPGTADWTHQYGDIANTLKSNDSRVKLPLGILWFGGNSNEDVLPRHGHGPPEQVVDGRLFIQGINSLTARDVYTGRVLWKREFENLGTFDVYYDASYEDVPLHPKYNQLHIPGANGRGTNYVVTKDRVYILEGSECHVLDTITGATLSKISLPADEDGEVPEWGYIGVYRDVLIGGLGFANFRKRLDLTFEKDNDLSKSKAGFGSKSFDRAASMGLAGFDRHTGALLWTTKANHSFWHNGIVAGSGKIFCLDKNPSVIEDAMRRRGLSMPSTYRIVALKYKTGTVDWELNQPVFGSWLGYSEQFDCLLQAGAQASDRLATETGQGMAVLRGADGSVIWHNESLKYAGPCILHNDLIITNANSYSESSGAYYLKTGSPRLITNPLTGREQPWTLLRTYGCNSIIASENMLTFRSGSASFCDLTAEAGTGNLGGFKSGCTSNLVVANGVLNAPDYTRTCSCSYQNQTSLGLVPMEDIEMWSVDTMATAAEENQLLQAVAVNFGAPGDRRDALGKLWLEYPVVSGNAPGISIKLNPEAKAFRRHSLSVAGMPSPWILASGLEGVTDLTLGMSLNDRIIMEAKKSSSDDDDDEGGNKKKNAKAPSIEAEVKEPKPARVSRAAKSDKQPIAPRQFDLKLYFAIPANDEGIRAFDVVVQGKSILNVELKSGGPPEKRYLIHSLSNITIADQLQLQFRPKQGAPIINGIEISQVNKD
jgi:outer membrane protein assembly factor BamB